jgi:hypothetical protein
MASLKIKRIETKETEAPAPISSLVKTAGLQAVL